MMFVSVLKRINNIVIISMYVWIIGKLCLVIVLIFNGFKFGYVNIFLIMIRFFMIIGIDI